MQQLRAPLSHHQQWYNSVPKTTLNANCMGFTAFFYLFRVEMKNKNAIKQKASRRRRAEERILNQM